MTIFYKLIITLVSLSALGVMVGIILDTVYGYDTKWAYLVYGSLSIFGGTVLSYMLAFLA